MLISINSLYFRQYNHRMVIREFDKSKEIFKEQKLQVFLQIYQAKQNYQNS